MSTFRLENIYKKEPKHQCIFSIKELLETQCIMANYYVIYIAK